MDFRKFLRAKADEIHAETFVKLGTPEWKYIKEQEILIGEIIREFKNGYGGDV